MIKSYCCLNYDKKMKRYYNNLIKRKREIILFPMEVVYKNIKLLLGR